MGLSNLRTFGYPDGPIKDPPLCQGPALDRPSKDGEAVAADQPPEWFRALIEWLKSRGLIHVRP